MSYRGNFGIFRTVAVSFVLTCGTIAAVSAHAQPAAGYYVAAPAATPTKAALVTRSTAWSLRDGVYVAPRAPERDTILCQLVAKDVGRLTAFSVAGQAYDEAALGKCNAKAR